jgi:hypothetical protein
MDIMDSICASGFTHQINEFFPLEEGSPRNQCFYCVNDESMEGDGRSILYILYGGQLQNRELHKKESKGVQGLKHSLISIFQN